MGPKTLKELEIGHTLMLAREIQERTSVSQVYEKLSDTEVRHLETGETLDLPSDELVYPFEASYAARQP